MTLISVRKLIYLIISFWTHWNPLLPWRFMSSNLVSIDKKRMHRKILIRYFLSPFRQKELYIRGGTKDPSRRSTVIKGKDSKISYCSFGLFLLYIYKSTLSSSLFFSAKLLTSLYFSHFMHLTQNFSSVSPYFGLFSVSLTDYLFVFYQLISIIKIILLSFFINGSKLS